MGNEPKGSEERRRGEWWGAKSGRRGQGRPVRRRMRGNDPGWKFGYLEVDKRRRNYHRHRGGRSGARLEYEGVDAADLLVSALIIRSFINRFSVMIVRRDVCMNQRSVMVMMRVRGGGRCVQMRVRQHHQT